MNPIGKARLTNIDYFIHHRKSPTYDISNYQESLYENDNKYYQKGEIKNALSLKDKIKVIRKRIGKIFIYPNDFLIITGLILIELITSNI